MLHSRNNENILHKKENYFPYEKESVVPAMQHSCTAKPILRKSNIRFVNQSLLLSQNPHYRGKLLRQRVTDLALTAITSTLLHCILIFILFIVSEGYVIYCNINLYWFLSVV